MEGRFRQALHRVAARSQKCVQYEVTGAERCDCEVYGKGVVKGLRERQKL